MSSLVLLLTWSLSAFIKHLLLRGANVGCGGIGFVLAVDYLAHRYNGTAESVEWNHCRSRRSQIYCCLSLVGVGVLSGTAILGSPLGRDL